MLRSLNKIIGYRLQAVDGEIGKVDDFYFEDLSWLVRYLVADTGTWLAERLVLLSPVVLGQADWETKGIPVQLTQEQIENSPPVTADLPVSRQLEAELHKYYNWVPYWQAGVPFAGTTTAVATQARIEQAADQIPGDVAQGDPHLQSVREVSGYHIYARDGEMGHVDDFIVEDESWTVRYLVIDTGNWLPGRRVLLVPSWVQKVDWSERMVYVDLQKDTIRESPLFDPSVPINRDYEQRLYDYYGRPAYWEPPRPE